MKYSKKIPFILFISSITLIFSCFDNGVKDNFISKDSKINNLAKQDTFTIQGYILEEITNKPPQGLFSLNITNEWLNQKSKDIVFIRGDNKKVYIDQHGYYKIKVKKEDTLQLVNIGLIYNLALPNYRLTNFDQDLHLNFFVKSDSTLYNRVISMNTEIKNKYDKILKQKFSGELVKVSGQISSKKTSLPIPNILVGAIGINNAKGTLLHHITDASGKFKLEVPAGTIIKFNVMHKTNNIELIVTKDTIVNAFL
ncbi:hypothetical protein [Myroides sp. LJL110]